MNLSEFLRELFAEGRVAVPAPEELTSDELQAAGRVLEEQDRLCRLETPAGAPQYDPEAAIWAATQFYRACQLAMFRDVGEEAIKKLSASAIGNWELAEVHYSVDLTFRFLPDLVRVAQSVATDDPLVNSLMNWCSRWPLSSVGVKGVGDVPLGPIAASPCLMLMYVDRILARDDTERLANEAVRRAVKQAIGLYPALAPKLATAANLMIEEA